MTYNRNDAYPYSRVDAHGYRECPECSMVIPPKFYADHWLHHHPDIEGGESLMADTYDPNDAYPYSLVDLDGNRNCPVCDEMIPSVRYAEHWQVAHPAHVMMLRALEKAFDPVDALNEWAESGYSLAPREPFLTAKQIRYLADTWIDTHPSFMDAVFDAIRQTQPKEHA